jgi:type III secretion protein C
MNGDYFNSRFSWGVRSLAVFILSLVACNLMAADLPWKQARKFERSVEQKELRELLREFTGGYGISVVVDQQVSGSVSGKFNLTPQSMLEYLATTYGFVWFYDGNVLYISPADSVVSEIIPLPAQSSDKSLRTLERLGLMDPRYPVSIDSRARIARVAGPKPYVDLVRNTLRGIDSEGGASDEATVKIYRLRYAYAADQKVDASSDNIVPGLASVLTQLFPAQAPNAGRAGQGASNLPSRMNRIPVRGTNMTLPEMPDPTAAIEAVRANPQGGAATGNALPQFKADQRLNAIIVRDSPARIAQYDEIIRSLDTKPLVIEIEARIIEVSTDEFESLGIDWRFSNGRVDIQAGRGPLPGLTFNGARNSEGPPFSGSRGATGLLGLPISSGVVATTVLGDAGRNLILRIKALAEQGKANVTASPRIMTLDNIEAVIEDAQQFYVRVASERDAGLFQVNSGTSLRVRPLVVAEDSGKQLKLAIRIEDGAPTEALVDSIPIVRRTSIGTWAFVKEGQSLLIGGFTQARNSEVSSGVPGLSSIPIIGNLFKTTEKKQLRVERLFMITPRIVEL